MPFYDLHVHTNLSIGENSVEEIVEFAKKLGLSGIGIVNYYPGNIEKLQKIEGIDLVSCIMIKPKNPEELDKLAKKVRNKAEVLMVHGGDYDINRAACENSLIDILCHPELGRKDSGLDHICVKAAGENNVAIEINFREILESYKKNKIYIISSMNKNIKLCKKYNAKIITTSGAVTKWGMRSGRELAAIANILGLELGEAIDTVSTIPETLVYENRKKLEDKKFEGVEVVEDMVNKNG
ncbi:MAG: RNase P subunit p30 family protein [Candidatus Aenigmatarchaeota archaeon]